MVSILAFQSLILTLIPRRKSIFVIPSYLHCTLLPMDVGGHGSVLCGSPQLRLSHAPLCARSADIQYVGVNKASHFHSIEQQSI